MYVENKFMIIHNFCFLQSLWIYVIKFEKIFKHKIYNMIYIKNEKKMLQLSLCVSNRCFIQDG